MLLSHTIKLKIYNILEVNYVCNECKKNLKSYSFGRQIPYEFKCDICGEFPAFGCEVTNVVHEEDPAQQDLFEDNEPGLCPNCNGSGEGMHDGTTCTHCKGSGEERSEE